MSRIEINSDFSEEEILEIVADILHSNEEELFL